MRVALGGAVGLRVRASVSIGVRVGLPSSGVRVGRESSFSGIGVRVGRGLARLGAAAKETATAITPSMRIARRMESLSLHAATAVVPRTPRSRASNC